MTSFSVPHLGRRWLTLNQRGPWPSLGWAGRAGRLWGRGRPHLPPCSYCARGVPRGCCCCCARMMSNMCHRTCPYFRRCYYCLSCYYCCCSFCRTFHCGSLDRSGETLYITQKQQGSCCRISTLCRRHLFKTETPWEGFFLLI